MLKIHDIVQITDKDHHWFPALVIVTEVKSFGCQGFMTVVRNNDTDTQNWPAYIRLRSESYEIVGHAVISDS